MAPRPEIPDPEERIERDWVLLAWGAVQQLPPRQRTVVILYCGRGLSLGQITLRERIAKETVRDALARAIARLRRSLEQT
jgi:DNA-directed RNA polymerase specialized sigma24 family protein